MKRVEVAAQVRRPLDEVAGFVTDPHRLLPIITGFGRYQHRAGDEWEVFMPIGTLQVGGMVRIEHPDEQSLRWVSERGMEHSFELWVEPDGDGTRMRIAVEYRLRGQIMAKLSEVMARGIVVRHLEAAAEGIRHHLEWGD